jgi:RNA polymerase sigma-70 factor (ECF subfamily)
MTKEEYINLFQKYHSWVVTECQNAPWVTKEDAEDISMQLFSALWENLNNINSTTVKTYLIRSARNKCTDQLRRKKFFNAYKKHTDTPYSEESLNKIEDRDLASIIQSIIETLPPKQRTLITLTHLHQYSREEICLALNTNPFTARNGLHLGLNNLRKRLLKHKITK